MPLPSSWAGAQDEGVNDTPRPDATPNRTALDPDLVRAGLDRERRILSEAILLVSTGGSPRVTVAGLRYAEQVLAASRPLAEARRVRLIPLWTDDEGGADVGIEPLEVGPR